MYIHTHTLTHSLRLGNFRYANSPHCPSLGCGRTPEYLEKTHADKGRMCKLHTDSGPARNQNFFLTNIIMKQCQWNDVIRGIVYSYWRQLKSDDPFKTLSQIISLSAENYAMSSHLTQSKIQSPKISQKTHNLSSSLTLWPPCCLSNTPGMFSIFHFLFPLLGTLFLHICTWLTSLLP